MAGDDDASLLSDFTYMDEALPTPPDNEEEATTPRMRTAFVLLQIVKSHYNVALDITDNNTTIRRLLIPKEYRDHGNVKVAQFNLVRDYKASALAAYILLPKTNDDICSQCSSHKSRGPCKDCVSFGPDVFKGACSNCKASGTPTACSFAKAVAERNAQRENIEKRKAMMDKEEELWFEQDDLKNHTTADLETLRETIDAEIMSRKVARTSTREAAKKRGRSFRSRVIE